MELLVIYHTVCPAACPQLPSSFYGMADLRVQRQGIDTTFITAHGLVGYECLDEETSRVPKRLQKLRELIPSRTPFSIELTLLVTLPASDFAAPPEPRSIRPPPNGDFRFRSLLDTSLHDFTIRCLDGVVTATRESLYQASIHFRDFFEMQRDVVVTAENANCLPVKQSLQFLLTGTFEHDGEMTPAHARQLFDVSRKYRPKSLERLRAAVQHHVFPQIFQHRDRLNYLLEFFLVAERNNLEALLTGPRGADAALLAELHQNGGGLPLFGQTPHSKLTLFFSQVRGVDMVDRPPPIGVT
ncbi:unnamed protein product, partial [Mesorhabditis spiculigera]